MPTSAPLPAPAPLPANVRRAARVELGWCELVDIECFGLAGIAAKIDTGARTSALHADQIAPFERDGARWVRFLSATGPDAAPVQCEAPVTEQRIVTSSNGADECRFIIDARIKLAGISFSAQLSLTDRTPMAFPMLVGRTALKRHFIVNVARRYVHGAPNPIREPHRGLRASALDQDAMP